MEEITVEEENEDVDTNLWAFFQDHLKTEENEDGNEIENPEETTAEPIEYPEPTQTDEALPEERGDVESKEPEEKEEEKQPETHQEREESNQEQAIANEKKETLVRIRQVRADLDRGIEKRTEEEGEEGVAAA